MLWCFDVDLERAVGWDDPDLLVLFAQGPGIEGLGSGFVYFWHSNEVPGAGVRLTTVSGLRPADNLTDIAMSYGTSEVRDWEGSLNGYVLLEGSDDWGMKAWLDTDLSIYGIDAGATCAD